MYKILKHRRKFKNYYARQHNDWILAVFPIKNLTITGKQKTPARRKTLSGYVEGTWREYIITRFETKKFTNNEWFGLFREYTVIILCFH